MLIIELAVTTLVVSPIEQWMCENPLVVVKTWHHIILLRRTHRIRVNHFRDSKGSLEAKVGRSRFYSFVKVAHCWEWGRMIICSHRNARRVILTATCVTLMATRRQPGPFWKCLFYVRDLFSDCMLTTYLTCQIRRVQPAYPGRATDNAMVDKH